ncbi:MAG: hypothetical protein IT285_10755 [Bdellovibrionales bacterium]|nr:hypothetical protein [Bdellovibrionales bacterium]
MRLIFVLPVLVMALGLSAADAHADEPELSTGPDLVTTVGVSGSGSESGGHFGVSGEVEIDGDTTMRLELFLGRPTLVMNFDGETHRFDVVLHQSDWTGAGVDHTFAITVEPVDVSAMLSVPGVDEHLRGRIQVSPAFAARYGFSTTQLNGHGHALSGSVGLKLGAAVGVAHDGDGTAPILGAQLTLEGELRYEITPEHSIDLSLRTDLIGNILGDLNHPWRVNTGLNYIYTLRGEATEEGPGAIRHEFNIGPWVNAGTYDVLRSDGSSGVDDGHFIEGGLRAGVSF